MSDATVLYAASYGHVFSGRPEERLYQHELAQALLYAALKQEYNINGDGLLLRRGEHGKPYFENCPVRFNLSHCGQAGKGLVCCALSEFEVGVDCAPLRPYDERLARRICTEKEYAALQKSNDPGRLLMTLWTQKESYLKLTGAGFRQGFRTEVASLPDVFTKTFDTAQGHLITVCSGHADLPREVKRCDLSL